MTSKKHLELRIRIYLPEKYAQASKLFRKRIKRKTLLAVLIETLLDILLKNTPEPEWENKLMSFISNPESFFFTQPQQQENQEEHSPNLPDINDLLI